MATTFVLFTRPHTVVHPATVLHSTTDGKTFNHIADVPEKVTHYTQNQVVIFRSKKAAQAFAKCMEGAAEVHTSMHTMHESTDIFPTK